MKELDDPYAEEITPGSRIRKAGTGRKPLWEEQPGILESLEELVSAHTKGDPMRALLWTNKSLQNLEAGLMGLFSFISKNWQGIPLISEVVIVKLISATRTDKGLTVTCVLDKKYIYQIVQIKINFIIFY
ncbi:MAG: hypothetical protein LBC31_06300 [Treponema sp.]|nr:hypothetical protein [Treponema sp.]